MCFVTGVLALDGMVLQITGSMFNPGDLILRYLSTNDVKTLDRGGCFGPSFSPDGRQVAYSQSGRIYIVNIDGSGKREVTTCGGSEATIAWTNSDYLYWSQCDPNIYRVKTDGTGKSVAFTSSKNIHALCVSDDGGRGPGPRPHGSCGLQTSTHSRNGNSAADVRARFHPTDN